MSNNPRKTALIDRARRKKPSGEKPLVDHVVAFIRSGLMRNRYAPGQRLVETDIMRELSVSRAPVRDALRRLAAEGVIVIEPHKSAVVPRLTRVGLESAFEIREFLEGLSAQLAAERLDQAKGGVRFAKAKLKELAIVSEVPSNQFMDRNEQFHDYIVELSGNVHLRRMLAQLATPVFRIHFPATLDPESLARSDSDHMEIVDAIIARDPAAALAAMRSHVRRTAILTQRLPSYIFTDEDM